MAREVKPGFDQMKGVKGIASGGPVSLEEIDRMTDEIEADILNSLEREVTSYRIGELAMEKLKQIDEVAYVRFASVYRQFADINTFMNELKSLLKEK